MTVRTPRLAARLLDETTRAGLIRVDPICRVLDAMAPDLTLSEWSERLGVDRDEVRVRALWLGVRVRA